MLLTIVIMMLVGVFLQTTAVPMEQQSMNPFHPPSPDIQVLLRGRDGRDGLPGVPGANGRDGINGERGERGRAGVQGPQGETGAQGPPGPTSGGVTYTRWGKTSCPTVSGTELVYSGITAGSWYDHSGGAADFLCLPTNPQYGRYVDGFQGSPIYGTEYETSNRPPLGTNLQDHNVPCAVCYVSTRVTSLMVPARIDCPTSWTREYSGYLMTAYKDHKRTTYLCVDSNADTIPNSSGNGNGALLYYVESTCNGLPCSAYVDGKELTCVVCTK